MADFGKLNFSTSLKPTSAFPLDARCYFTSLELAKTAAACAEEVGSTNTLYYYGMKLCVDDGETVKWYTIQRDNTLREEGGASEVAEETIHDIVNERLKNFFVVGPDEPEHSPCIWLDTQIDEGETGQFVYLVASDTTEET